MQFHNLEKALDFDSSEILWIEVTVHKKQCMFVVIYKDLNNI